MVIIMHIAIILSISKFSCRLFSPVAGMVVEFVDMFDICVVCVDRVVASIITPESLINMLLNNNASHRHIISDFTGNWY